MQSAQLEKVVAPDGAVGMIDTRAWPLDGSRDAVLVEFAEGRRYMLPLSSLVRQPTGELALTTSLSDLAPAPGQEPIAIPIVQERAQVGKRAVETGRVRVTKTVHEEVQTIDPVLLWTDVVVERVPINRPVDSPPPVRQEGQTTIVPVVEEQLVVEKRLVLREELHVTRRTTEYHEPQRVVLRREQADVQRLKSFEESNPAGTDIATSSSSSVEQQMRHPS